MTTTFSPRIALILTLFIVFCLIYYISQHQHIYTETNRNQATCSYLDESNLTDGGVKKLLAVDSYSTNTDLDKVLTATVNGQAIKKPNSHLAFLKVHKAGSSTAQNIFLRYGESRNLTFVLSKVRKGMYDNVIALSHTLNKDNILPPPPNKTFDILCCHVLYNRTAFQKYLPKDTAYIGIVRDPFQQFLSTLNYFKPYHVFGNNKTSQIKALEYLKNPWKYEPKMHPEVSFTNNRMAVEFDFPLKLLQNYSKDESNAYLRQLDLEFQLVMVLEYFVESVVLMRRILKWNVKDVLFLKINVANKYSIIDNTYRYLYVRYAKLDDDLYNFFYKRLWEKIDQEGKDFQMELLYFRHLLQETEDYCKIHAKNFGNYSVQASKWSESFNITYQDCQYMSMHESVFVNKIRHRQYG